MTPAACIAGLRAAGMTQKQIADHTGLAQPTISKIENGSIQDVRSQTFLKLQSLHDKTVPSANKGKGRANAAGRL